MRPQYLLTRMNGMYEKMRATFLMASASCCSIATTLVRIGSSGCSTVVIGLATPIARYPVRAKCTIADMICSS